MNSNMELNTSSSLSCNVDATQNPILKPSLGNNLIVLQTPVHKHLKVRFQTPSRTPLTSLQNSVFPNKSSELFLANEEERWRERIEVVTKYDHEEYVRSAQQFIDNIVCEVVHRCHQKKGSLTNKLPPTPIETVLETSGNNLSSADLSQDSFEVVDLDDKENILPEDECLFAPFKNENSKFGPSPQTKPNSSFIEFNAVPTNSNPAPIISESHIIVDLERNKNPFQETPNLNTLYSVFQDGSNTEIQPCNENDSAKKIIDESNLALQPPAEPVSNVEHFTSSELKQRNKNVVSDDGFQDATSLVEGGFDFDLDFLEKKGNQKITSDLRKQSLYLKFDPLVAGENPTENRTLIGRKSDIIDLCGHVSLPRLNEQPITEKVSARLQEDLLCASPSSYSKRNGEVKCSKADDEMMKSNSKETWLSAHSSDGQGIVELLKYTEADVEKIKEPLQQQISCANKQLTSQQEQIDQMQVVLQEFETTVMEMTEKFEQEKNKLEMEKTEMIVEQEKTVHHLESVEKAYLDLLQRSEQMKKGIGNYKINEETYKNVISEYQSAQEASQQRYKALKATMEESQNKLETEFCSERKELRSQLSALKARCKFLENQAKSLQLQLDQKTSENSELTKICDELIEQQQHSTSLT